MKLFLKKLLLFLLIFGLVCGAVDLGFFLYMGRMTPAYTDRFIKAPARIRVANLGSSHGQSGFCYDNAPALAAVNLGYGSQPLQYDLRVLEGYIDRFDEGSMLYIPVSYSSFFSGDITEGSDFLSLNQRYYYILPRELILGFSWKEWLISKLPGLHVPNWLSEFWKSDEFDAASLVTAESMDVAADAEEAIARHLPSPLPDGSYPFREENVAYLVDIIRLCKEHGVTPVIVTTPFLGEYTARAPAGFLQEQQAIIDRVCLEEDVRYLDFSRDKRFSGRYELFLNSDHLNRYGALAFTDLLLSGALPEE